MSIWDWLGPLNSGGKRTGWADLPALPAERKQYSWTQEDRGAALTVRTLVHGPGATDLMNAERGGDGNSAVYACLQAIATAYVEAPLVVYRQTSPKDREPQFDSPLQLFLDFPNPELDLLEILAWVQWAKHVDGNAYLRKLRSGNDLTGNVVELWPISPTRIEPRTDKGSGDLVSFYRYYDRPGHYEDIPRDNMVHFRMGTDDRDHRLGCAPLKRLLREVSSDDQATRYADRLLANLAINGLSLEFAPDRDPISPADADMLKARIQAAYSGDNVGAVSVLSPGAKLVSHGFSPEQMDLKVLHRVPEERISAVLRVPAIVAGLGAGLDRSTFANYAEANQSFIENTILSLYRADDKKLTHSLAVDFTTDRKISIAHDISQMRALQDDEDKKATRLSIYVAASILDIDEARAEIGREPRVTAPALPAPAKLRALPAKALAVETKAAGDVADGLARLRDSREPGWQAEVQTYLDGLHQRIQRRLGAGHDTAETLVAEVEATLLGETLRPLQTALLTDVHGLVLAELGIAFDLDDPLTRRYLAAAGTRAVGITDTTREAVRAALTEGQHAGEGIDQLAARLRDLPAFDEARARVVARTELAHASNTAAIANYHASGVVVGIRVHDGDGDAQCAAMNGRTFPLGQEPPTLQHPNCLVGESMVIAPNVNAAFTRWFDGEVVVIRTASDDLLTCTPNHPILTGRGWAAAGALREGDYVIRSLDSQRIARFLDPRHDYMPTRIEQIADTLWPAGFGTSTAVPCTAEDFHGDAVDGEVCVVRANGRPGGGFEPLLAQHRSKLLVQGRFPELAGLPGFGSLAEFVIAAGYAAHGRMGGLSQRGPFISSDSFQPAAHRLGSSGLLADGVKPSTGRGLMHAEVGRDLLRSSSGDLVGAGVTTYATGRPERHPERAEISEQRSLSDADAVRDPLTWLAGAVAPVQIVEVQRRQFAGHVYNLETEQGWYIAENIITHNCLRAFSPIVDASELERSA